MYMQIVPAQSALVPIASADMVKPILSSEIDEIHRSKPVLFTKLVPFAVHESLSLYSTKKDATVKDLISSIEVKQIELESLLESVKLPDAISATARLPDSLWRKASELQSKNGRLYVINSIGHLASMNLTATQRIQECDATLDKERMEDDDLRRQFGDRWTRQRSVTLTKELLESLVVYRDKLEEAKNSDFRIQERFRESEQRLMILSLPKDRLEMEIPECYQANDLREHPAFRNLVDIAGQLRTLKLGYDTMKTEVQGIAKDDDICMIH